MSVGACLGLAAGERHLRAGHGGDALLGDDGAFMKRWLAGICGVASLLIFGVIAYFWIAGFSMAVALLCGTPLYLGKPEHQLHVNYWMVVILLTICPAAFGMFGVWLLRIAIRRHKSVA